MKMELMLWAYVIVGAGLVGLGKGLRGEQEEGDIRIGELLAVAVWPLVLVMILAAMLGRRISGWMD